MTQITFNGFKKRLLRGLEDFSLDSDLSASVGFTYFELVKSSATVGSGQNITTNQSTRDDIASSLLIENNSSKVRVWTDLSNASDDTLITKDQLAIVNNNDTTLLELSSSNQGTYLEYDNSFDYGGLSARGLVWLRDLSETGTISNNDPLIGYFDFTSLFNTSSLSSTKVFFPPILLSIS